MRIIVKIGSNIVAGGGESLNTRRIRSIAKAVSALHDGGHEVVLVSSGAIAAGMKKMGLNKRPRSIMLKQAAAAAGQPALMWLYEKYFKAFRKQVAQVLLTRDGLADRKMYINSKNTLIALIEHGLIPVVNENDTVATDEIRFGDNDQLAFLVAALIEADRLVILSDVAGLYTKDPKKHKRASIIRTVTSISGEMLEKAGAADSEYGTGGMYSKLLAADKAMKCGITVNVVNGHKPALLVSLAEGKHHGTEFRPAAGRLAARKSWIAFGLRMKGSIVLDDGAAKAVAERGKSLLPSGIASVEGAFSVGDAVYCVDSKGKRMAKGITNYSSDELNRIKGRKTSEIEGVLGYRYSEEVIHRDNMVVLK
ncbi:MAG: glutamate 5-kinase [Nitrospirota bacterium]|jgi:glutamate 5-kinase